jgi:hypothetical protein
MWQIATITVHQCDTAVFIEAVLCNGNAEFTLCPNKVASLFDDGELVFSFDDEYEKRQNEYFDEIDLLIPTRENIDLSIRPAFTIRKDNVYDLHFETGITGSMTIQDYCIRNKKMSKVCINNMNMNLVLSMVDEYFTKN